MNTPPPGNPKTPPASPPWEQQTQPSPGAPSGPSAHTGGANLGNCSRLSPNAAPPPASGSPTPAADSVSTLGVWGRKPWDGAGVTQAQGRALGTDKATRKKLFFITTCPRFWGQSLRVMPGPGNRKKKIEMFPSQGLCKGIWGRVGFAEHTVVFWGEGSV